MLIHLKFSVFRLEIGVGVGVPLVIIIIVCMVITYCCCAFRQRRRERTVYYNEYEEDEELVTASSFKANKDDLPPYSEADPFTEEPPEYSADDSNTNSSTSNDNVDSYVNN